jgi:hypothetical protein
VAAVRACGFVQTEENVATLTAEQLRQWDDAMEAWFAKHPDAE